MRDLLFLSKYKKTRKKSVSIFQCNEKWLQSQDFFLLHLASKIDSETWKFMMAKNFLRSNEITMVHRISQ